jgi:hypothetical protein
MKKEDIFKTSQTVFSFKELLLRFKDEDPDLLKRKLNYYVKEGELISLRRGVYATKKDYNKYELATKIYTPSYISLETVLKEAGVIFQYSSDITLVSYLTREIKINNQDYSYKKIKDLILTNDLGVKKTKNYFIAIPERAFLDMLYLNKDYYFDNLSTINWEKISKILPIYSNKRMDKEVNNYIKKYVRH